MSKFTPNIFFIIFLIAAMGLISFQADVVKVFRDSNSTIYLKLPEDWQVQLHEDESSIQMFLSREREIFTAGVIVTKIYNVSSIYKIDINSDHELINYWNNRLIKASEHYIYSEEINQSRINYGGYSGIKKESKHQYNNNLQTVHTYTLILANNGNIITLVALAPENEWSEYQPIFEQAIKSLELK